MAYLKEKNPFEFEFKGSIKNNFPFQNKLNTWLANSYTANLFSLSFPLVFESDVAQFVRQIKAIKLLYLKKTNQSNKFYFIFYPSSVGEDPYQGLIIKYLNQYEIDYLNYSKSTTLGMITNKPYLLPESHPNRHANELFTEMLKNDLPK